MIHSFQTFEIDQHPILDRAVFTPPMTSENVMVDEACFLFTIRGKSNVLGPGEAIPLKTNEGVVMKCGSYLSQWLAVSEYETCEAIAVHIRPEILRKVFDNKLPDFLTQPLKGPRVMLQKVQLNAMLENYIESLLFYFENPSLVNDELLSLKVKELLLLLVKTENAQQIHGLLQGLFDPETYNFRQVVEQNLFNNLSLQDWATLTSLSVSTFKRKFSDTFGDSPARYVRNRKLDKAAKLIQNSQQRISDIAFASGFEDVAYFSKCFSQKYGVPPSEYRLRYSS